MTPPPGERSVSWRDRSLGAVQALASLLMAAFFVWSLFDENGIPTWLGIAVAPAAVIVLASAAVELVRRRRKRREGDASDHRADVPLAER